MTFSSIRQFWYSRLISLCLMVTFATTMIITPGASLAQGVAGLPEPGTMVNLSSSYVPLMLTGLTVHAENPLLMDFIVSTGNSGMTADQVKKESDRLIKYFLACLTIPENDQWVNLSPYEKQRIVPEDLGQTVLGQDMLAQDYLLKQLTASLIYPEKNLGRNFWDKVYAKANEMYGSTQIPVNTFNKVWILPDIAKVYEHKDTVFVVKSHLKVMLDEDYLALQKHTLASPSSRNDTHSIGANIVRQIIVPAIEQEVNTGKNFAQLRQIYNSMILAVWFKQNLKQALLNQVYTDKSKVNGVNVDDPTIKEKIYKQYLQAYKKGVFNYIKEDVDHNSQQVIPRKYFSGGLDAIRNVVRASLSEEQETLRQEPSGNIFEDVRVGLGKAGSNVSDAAMKVPAFNLKNPFGNQRYWLKQNAKASDLVEDMFRDYDYRYEKKGQELNPAIVYRLGLVWAKMALEKAKKAGITNRTVLIARDARRANPEIMDALVAAMRYSGLNVIYTAADTPNAVTSYSWAVQQYKPLMSIFHTASHVSRPSDVFVRGFKVAIMDEIGGGVKSLTTKEIKQYSFPAIRNLMENPYEIATLRGSKLGTFQLKNVDENVIRFNTLVGAVAASNGSLYELGEALRNSNNPVAVLAQFEKRYSNGQPLKGIKVVVDGSHTPSGLLAVRTFEKLGAEVIALNTDIQDIWGEHKADPSAKENLVELEAKIKETGAHFGLAFDLDGDRGAILVPESTGEVAYKEFHSLAPDNLLGVLLPSLINQWGYKDSGKEMAIIRDVLGTQAVNDRGKELGIPVYQTDAGYVFLKAKKEELEKKGMVVPMYGERSGHTWLHVSGEVENPLAVAVLFAVLAKQKMDANALNPVYDVYQSLTIPYSQSPRFQPIFHPDLLKKLGEDTVHNPTTWRYNPENPTNPPQVIISNGKDQVIKMLQKKFKIGDSFPTSAGNLTVAEFYTFQDAVDEGGRYRYADIVFNQNGRFAGRYVFRASSNDPSFVNSYEAPQWENEDIQTTNKRKVAIAKLVLDYLRQGNIALVTKEEITASGILPADKVENTYKKYNLNIIEGDLNDVAMGSFHPVQVDQALTVDDEFQNGEPDAAMLLKEKSDYQVAISKRSEKANTPFQRRSPDRAALAPGGIDLNSRTLNMESFGQKVNITFDPAMIAQFKRGDFSGVKIQILDVVPVNLMPLLGLN